MRHARLTVLFLVVSLAAALLVPTATAQEEPDGRYRQNGDVAGFFNVMPPGQKGVFNAGEAVAANAGQFPAFSNDQTALYESIAFEAGQRQSGEHGEPLLGISDGDLERFFKEASFGAANVARSYTPPGAPEGLVIIRDADFGVPHIYGETREAAMFGAGWIAGEDRLFLVDVLRHLGRARLSEFLGASPANRELDREQLRVAPYRDEEYTAQSEAICAAGDEGARICADAEAYIAGLNAYVAAARTDPRLLPNEYVALQQVPDQYVPEDIVAIASLVGGIFGRGGGREVANGRFLAQLEAAHGEAEARAIFEDFRSANDPEAPITTTTPFAYNNHTDIDPASTAILDLETVDETLSQMAAPELIADGPLGPIDLRPDAGMSNAILITADHADGGVPIAVFGPQTGYFTPQLLVEYSIHAPGIDARGASFAGTNIYVQLGRGRNYAWSATSAGGDNVDQWVVRLCEPDGSEPTAESQAYLHQGECKEMDVYTHTQIAKPSAGGLPDPSEDSIVFEVEVERIPDYDFSPVVARGTVDGEPVAVFDQRTTYGQELRSAFGFLRINDPDYMAGGAQAFMDAFDGVDYTFNWFYVDEADIAYKHSCLCPVRHPRTDPDLPTWGDGNWDWTGEFLTPEQQPHEVNPPRGYFANWNNKQAPQFRANDGAHSYSSTYRSEFLRVRLAAALATGTVLTRADMVNIAIDAATVDLNGQEIYPLVLTVLGESAPEGDATLQAMRDALAGWAAAGGHRRDLDDDGTYDHAVAVAIGDAALRPILDAVFGDELGEAEWPQRVEDHPNQGVGSAYNGGRANFLHKDLRQVLGLPVEGARSRTYCGQGDLAACREALWGALAQAAEALAEEFGSDAVEDWVYDARDDDITQDALGTVQAPDMVWQNRPTFHQVAQPGSRIGRVSGPTRTFTAAATSRQSFPDGADVVVVASADGFPDAVAGTPLAAANDAPLLLTPAGGLVPETLHEILRLGATQAFVLGGTAALSEQVVTDLEDAGLEVTRIGGANRFETAALIAAEIGEFQAAVVALGEDFPDALAAGPFAVAESRPILLTSQDALPDVTAEALDGVTDIVVAGGPAAVSDAVVAQLSGEGVEVRRIAGDTRYHTARAFADAAVEAGAGVADTYVTTGENFPDALTAGAAAAATGGVLLLTTPDAVVGPLGEFLGANAADVLRLWLVGGRAVLTPGLRAQLEATL